MYSLSKEQTKQSMEAIQNAFFFLKLCPFFDLDFLSSINFVKNLVCVVKDKMVFLVSLLQLEYFAIPFSLTLYSTDTHFNPFPKQALVFTCLQYKSFENTAGKGEIAHNKQFLLFAQCSLPVWKTFCQF